MPDEMMLRSSEFYFTKRTFFPDVSDIISEVNDNAEKDLRSLRRLFLRERMKARGKLKTRQLLGQEGFNPAFL